MHSIVCCIKYRNPPREQSLSQPLFIVYLLENYYTSSKHTIFARCVRNCHAERSEASRAPRERDPSLRSARQQCHAERSEASPCRARQTLRFAQGDRAALSVTPKGNTSPLRLNRPHDKHQPGW